MAIIAIKPKSNYALTDSDDIIPIVKAFVGDFDTYSEVPLDDPNKDWFLAGNDNYGYECKYYCDFETQLSN